jgi:hypothetical protein
VLIFHRHALTQLHIASHLLPQQFFFSSLSLDVCCVVYDVGQTAKAMNVVSPLQHSPTHRLFVNGAPNTNTTVIVFLRKYKKASDHVYAQTPKSKAKYWKQKKNFALCASILFVSSISMLNNLIMKAYYTIWKMFMFALSQHNMSRLYNLAI